MQYFTGMLCFTHKFPCDPSDFVHFRDRLKGDGIKKIFDHIVELHNIKKTVKVILSDTTIQENHTTFPTDAKLAKKIIDKSNQIARLEGVEQRQSYLHVSKQLLRDANNGLHYNPKRAQ